MCFDLHCTLLHCYIHNGDAQTQYYLCVVNFVVDAVTATATASATTAATAAAATTTTTTTTTTTAAAAAAAAAAATRKSVSLLCYAYRAFLNFTISTNE